LAISTPEGYRALDEKAVAPYLAGLPALRARLGGAPESWRVSEVGDGNLNLVFIVEGADSDLCVKQALPYVRLVGEGWPLDIKRAWFEHRAAVIQSRHAPQQVPQMLHFDEKLHLMAMERLAPHIIMRRGMIQGVVYPAFAEQIAEYLATTLYFTSDLALPAAAIREDQALKRAVSALKLKFMSEAQALLHGDLHTGSIMVTEDDTRVIDPEFAFVGPIGFDVGKLLGNLLMSFFSQRGHERAAGEREAYRRWILATVEEVWTRFARRFVALWNAYPTGDAYPRALFDGPEGKASLRQAQAAYLRRLLEDALGFAGAAMIRRTLGLAHNIDMERIEDPELRASCERRNLTLARDLVVDAAGYAGIEAVTARAAAIEAAPAG
jgi:5-methylthioribose kinase